MNHDQYSDYINLFIKNAGPIPREIFSRWIDGLLFYYEQTLEPDEYEQVLTEPFVKKKCLTYLLPYYSLLRSPFHLPALDTAVDLLKAAYEKKDQLKIVLYGDRDADGICSSAILYLFLVEQMKFSPATVVPLLPLEEDKYGITNNVADRILAEKPNLVITLDCGSSNKESLAYLKEKSESQVDIIVIDHHFIPADEKDFPQVEAFVNPKRLPLGIPERDLCTAGIALKLIWALTYGFTSEYNQVSEVTANGLSYFVKNGVEIEQGPATRTITFDENTEADVNAKNWWQEAVKQNKQVARLAQVLQNNNGIISPVEKLQILQNLRFTRVYEKIKTYFSLAAVGTIADMMPLIDDNRIMVAFGLAMIRSNSLPRGLYELIKACGLADSPIAETDLSFTVCPTINAAGRLGSPEKSLHLLIETDPLEAAKKAHALREVNEERKRLSKEAFDLLAETIKPEDEEEPILIAYHNEVHRGISGLVAGKLAEQFKKPAMVIVEDGDCLRGSLRSYQAEDIFSYLEQLGPMLIQFGGHRQAAGFSLAHEKRREFVDFAHQKAREYFSNIEPIKDMRDLRAFNPPLKVKDSDIISRTWQEWLSFAPYGIMNPHPVIAIEPTRSVAFHTMGEDNGHARLNFKGIADASIEGVWFFHGEDMPKQHEKKLSKIFAEPHLNYFAGKIKYQLKVKRIDYPESQ